CSSIPYHSFGSVTDVVTVRFIEEATTLLNILIRIAPRFPSLYLRHISSNDTFCSRAHFTAQETSLSANSPCTGSSTTTRTVRQPFLSGFVILSTPYLAVCSPYTKGDS